MFSLVLEANRFPATSISVPVRALGVSPSALFSAESSSRPCVCTERGRVSPTRSPLDPFLPYPAHTHSGLGAVVLKSSLPYLPRVCSHFAESGDSGNSRVSFSFQLLLSPPASFFLPSLLFRHCAQLVFLSELSTAWKAALLPLVTVSLWTTASHPQSVLGWLIR